MGSTTLHIKNMVCNRCIRAVQEEIESLGFTIKDIELGEVVLNEETEAGDLDRIDRILAENGFELIKDKRSEMINRIKTLIIEYIHYDKEKPHQVNLLRFPGGGTEP